MENTLISQFNGLGQRNVFISILVSRPHLFVHLPVTHVSRISTVALLSLVTEERLQWGMSLHNPTTTEGCTLHDATTVPTVGSLQV